MSHTTVYSPQGEMFEVSALNAHDLVTHAGWSYDAPNKVPVAEEAAPEEVDETADETDEDAGDDAGDETSEDDASDETAAEPFTTEEQFAALTEREDVVAYLAETFPDYKPHHLAKRESLIAKAIELATA